MEENNEWKKIREDSKKKRWENRDKSISILDKWSIPYKMLSENNAHYRILLDGGYDFWPTTGKFIHLKTGKQGRGIMNLIQTINNKQ